MKRTGSSWLTIIITAVVGILLIVWHTRIDILSWVMIAVGVMFLIPSVYSLINTLTTRVPSGAGMNRTSAIITGIGGVVLGLWMIINPGFFVGLTAYLFAVLLIAYGVFQIVLVGYMSRPFRMPGILYIVPVLMIAGGVVILCTTVRTMNSVVVLIAGILLIASAVNWAIELSMLHPARMRGGNAS